jgi:carboxylesterase type B
VFRLLALIIQIFTLTSIVDAKVFSTQMSQRVVETRYGRLRGILVELPIQSLPSVDAYLGIEYGSLHSGELRFLPPTSPATRPWTGIRTAMKFKPVCPQPLPDFDELQKTAPEFVIEHLKRIVPFIERQQEDCLHLNVYVPAPG